MPKGDEKGFALINQPLRNFGSLKAPSPCGFNKTNIVGRQPARGSARARSSQHIFEQGHCLGSDLRRCDLFGLFGKLHGVEAGIGAILGEKFRVGSLFNDLPAIHYINCVGCHNG